MKILIKVTKEILEKTATCTGGIHSQNCAIALAVREFFPKAGVSCVGINTISAEDHSFRREDNHCIDIPSVASDFVARFDWTRPQDRPLMDPISFEIDVPSEVIDKIGLQEVYKILSESKTLELVNP